MSTLGVTLRAEISRLARKEVRSTSTALGKAMARHRSQIASLKRRMQELEAGLRGAGRQAKSRRLQLSRRMTVAKSCGSGLQVGSGLRFSHQDISMAQALQDTRRL